jgi:peptidoglycan/xylan/chitin deacetylase (PgdA/CDA1 family)
MFDLTLSFDNGPEPEVTPGVLDALAARDIRATFFVLGSKLATPAGRALAERAHAAGHWIGNHTWSHGQPLGTRPGAETVEAEIARTQAELGPLAHPDKFFRPHGGGSVGPQLLSRSAADYLVGGGYTCVLWNAIPRDWAEPDAWVETALEQCASQPWSVMVLHDIPSGAMKHLARFLDTARSAGARFRQDFPAEVTPILRGQGRGDLPGIVSG